MYMYVAKGGSHYQLQKHVCGYCRNDYTLMVDKYCYYVIGFVVVATKEYGLLIDNTCRLTRLHEFDSLLKW